MKYTSIQDRTKKRKSSKIIYILIPILVVIWGIMISSPSEGVIWPSPITHHSPSMPELWSLSDIYVNVNSQPLITALDNKLVILGSDDISSGSNVIAFDGNTGHALWRMAYDGISISSVSSNVIVGGAGKVTALDGNDGKVLWNTTLQANVTKIILNDRFLYVYGAASNRYYAIDPTNGNILEKLKGTYTIEQEPSLGNNAYLRNGSGDVLALDKANGQELWKAKANAISNLAVTTSFVYVLDRDGSLLKINSQTGIKESITIFSPAPFMLHSNGEGGFEYPYYVAVDPHINILFVYLGDSAQLFAFQLP